MDAAAKKRLGLKLAPSIRDLTFRELHLPWALYSMSLFRRKHKFPLVGLAFVRACSRDVVNRLSRIVHAAATAAKLVARQRGRGHCERPDDVIAKARRGGRPAASRLVGDGNVSGSSGLKMAPTVLGQTRAWVISKSLLSVLAKKIFVAGQAAT